MKIAKIADAKLRLKHRARIRHYFAQIGIKDPAM